MLFFLHVLYSITFYRFIIARSLLFEQKRRPHKENFTRLGTRKAGGTARKRANCRQMKVFISFSALSSEN